MFSLNLVSWLERAFALIWTDDAYHVANDPFEMKLAGTIADALTAAVVERKSQLDEVVLSEFRTLVTALRHIERGEYDTDLASFVDQVVHELAVRWNIDAALAAVDA